MRYNNALLAIADKVNIMEIKPLKSHLITVTDQQALSVKSRFDYVNHPCIGDQFIISVGNDNYILDDLAGILSIPTSKLPQGMIVMEICNA